MAYSYNVYTGNGSTTQFTIGFSYIRREHVKVYVAYVDTAYTYVNNTTVQLATAPGAGVRVEVRRVTPATTPLVDFADGSTLVAADLDTSNLQHLYLEQELDDANKQAIFVDPATGLLTAASQRITNVADPVNAQDVSTKAYTDAQIDSALINDVIAGTGLTISDNTPTAGQITVGITNSGVGVTQIADGAVTSAKIADATIITGDLADGAVTSAKIADGTIVAGDLASDSVTTAKILNANVTTAKIADLNVTTGKIADLGVTTGKIADAAVTAAKIAGGSIDSTKLDGATVVTNSEVAGVSPNDTSFFTTSASDLRYFRQDSSETISSGQTWSASDSYVATTAAIDARVIDLVDDVGGFVPIANENSFPVANPDINNPDGTGTIVSIAVMSTSRTPSSGTVTIANGSGSNTVTITGCGSTVLAAGFGVLVETTSTLHTYTFHRLTPKATEVTTVASISADVTTVAGNNANVTAVAGNATNITTVAGSIANVNAVGGSISNVNSVASNLASVNSFANTYRIAASDPATSLDVGDLVFNTTANELRVYNGSVWQGGVTATGNLVSRSGDTMTGALAHPLGAAATPSITFTGSTNTGIYSPSSGAVAISTNSTQRLVIDASGNVGVGTNSPTQTAANRTVLSVNGTTTSLVNLNAGGVSKGYLIYDGTNVALSAGVGSLYLTADSANPIVFATNGSEKVRITSSGAVGVGVSAPSRQLDVRSTAIFDSNGDGTGSSPSIAIGSTSVGLSYVGGQQLSFTTGGAEKVRLDASGRLGIGTSSWDLQGVSTKLGVQLAGTTGDGIAFLSTQSTANQYVAVGAQYAGGNTNNGSQIRFGIDSVGDTYSMIAFATANGGLPSEKMRLDRQGRLGIGTSPSYKLHVSGNNAVSADNTIAMSYGRAANPTDALHKITWGSDDLRIEADTANTIASNITFHNDGVEKARLDSSGRLLVGTSSSSSVARGVFQGSTTDNAGVLDIAYNGAGTGLASGNTYGALRFTTQSSSPSTVAEIVAVADAGTSAGDFPSRLVFSTTADGAASPTERVRITSAGALLVGTTSQVGSGNIVSVGSTPRIVIRNTAAASDKYWGLNADGNNSVILYNNGGSGVWIGDGGTTWNSSSDERLKDIAGGFPNASDSVDQLRAVRFTWKSDEWKTPRVGLIAQDVEKVVPEAVAVDPNGYKSVAYTDLIPLLTAALQEANAKIKSLETRLTAAGIA